MLARILSTVALLWPIAPIARAAATPPDAYVEEVQKWRADYDRDLLGDDGPFTLVTRLEVGQGVSSIGADRSSDLVLPVKGAPARVGAIEWQGGTSAIFRVAKGVDALVAGKPVSQVHISEPVRVSIADMRLRFAFRDEQLRVSVSDLHADARKRAVPSVWFRVDPRYRILAKWVRFAEPKRVRIPDSDGSSREWKSPGYAQFTVDGKPVTLQGMLAPDGKELTFWFRDETAGVETYGTGRFIDTEAPTGDTVVVDFNKAYNPSCAFNPLYVCPIPPRENHLPVRIPAGERNYPLHDGH